ncbi:MAG: flagellar basal body rod protein FlgB [Acidobacteriaceae bacterium]
MPIYSSIDMLQNYLKVLTDRQQLITANMANIDTPGYHTQDVNFDAALRQVMQQGWQEAPEEEGDIDGGMDGGADGGIDAAPGPQLEEATLQIRGLPERPDGNNVNVDRESMMMAQTQLQFDMGVQLVKSNMAMVMTAIKEES